MRNQRITRAFTLIELMVVIAIIAILITIAVFGMKHVLISTAKNTTSVQLQSLRGLIAELETTGKLASRQPSQMWVKGALNPTTPGAGGIDIWYSADPGAANQPSAIDAPGDVTVPAWDSADPNLSGRFNSDAVANTQLVMRLLMANPNNLSAVQKIPPDQLLKNPEQGKSSPMHPVNSKLIMNGGAGGAISPPVPVDAWQNPIIFVPSGGLRIGAAWAATQTYKAGAIVVDDPTSLNPKTYRAIKANGNAAVTDTRYWEQVPGTMAKITSPDNRPFFASAGPDGDFRTTDDNLYSFQQ